MMDYGYYDEEVLWNDNSKNNILNEFPFAKDAFEEYKHDKEELNDDERYYAIFTREPGYDI